MRVSILVSVALLASACSEWTVGKQKDPPVHVHTGLDSDPPEADADADADSDSDSDADADADADSDADADPQAGCADGQREGFEDWSAYPSIAACSGAWEVGGVTRSDLAPTCSRGGGDDSGNSEGWGCSAADLCASGWHVCQGKTEVGSKASSCDDAVPWGTPDKALFFAVHQNSDNNSVCDDSSSNGNDVFGCGNLGTDLSSDKDCGVLNKVLASMNAGTCGYNEAEPSHGPWECDGGSDSHYHEGELVTKVGCPGTSCSYDGNPVGNSDKGGVLCCRD
jgi:hypothetical protein